MEFENVGEHIKSRLLKKGADDVVVILSRGETEQIKFSNNRISAVQTWNDVDANVFLALKKRTVTTSIENLSKKSIDLTINKLIKLSKVMKPNEHYLGIAEGPFKYKEIKDGYDKKIREIDLVDHVESGITAALNNGAERTAGVFETSSEKIFLTTSNDVVAEEERTSLYYSLRAMNNKEASGHLVFMSRVLKGFNPDKIARDAAEISKNSLNPRSGMAGKMDILFSPLSFANLLDRVGKASSIFHVETGMSFLANSMNRRVASDAVDIIDDGSLPNGFGSSKFDSEGVPTQKNVIIRRGILKTYLHNTSSATRYKTRTTANAGLVVPRAFNMVLEGGSWKKDEMIELIEKGLYVTNLWYTRFNNYSTGDFSTIPRDGIFYVERGEIKFPVKGIRISDNMINILKSISAIGNDQVHLKGWDADIPALVPHVLVKNINITKP